MGSIIPQQDYAIVILFISVSFIYYYVLFQQQSYYSGLINLLPILLLVGLSMMSSFFISDPIYSLQPNQ